MLPSLGLLLLLLLLLLVFLPLLLVSQILDELVGEEADQCKCNYRGQNEDPIVEAVLNGAVRSSSGQVDHNCAQLEVSLGPTDWT